MKKIAEFLKILRWRCVSCVLWTAYGTQTSIIREINVPVRLFKIRFFSFSVIYPEWQLKSSRLKERWKQNKEITGHTLEVNEILQFESNCEVFSMKEENWAPQLLRNSRRERKRKKISTSIFSPFLILNLQRLKNKYRCYERNIILILIIFILIPYSLLYHTIIILCC